MYLGLVFQKSCIRNYGNCKTMRTGLPPRPVNDEYVAIIRIRNGICVFGKNECIYFGGKKRPKEITDTFKRMMCPVICIVLESPHKYEYHGSTPLGPALSTTGRNLEQYLLPVLNMAIASKIIHLRDGIYRLLLVNAVSYQCSNASNLKLNGNKKARDIVFSDVWACGGKKEFLKRIVKYKPSLIINSCTGGFQNVKNPNDLNGKVTECLIRRGLRLVASAHPSSCFFWKKGLRKI